MSTRRVDNLGVRESFGEPDHVEHICPVEAPAKLIGQLFTQCVDYLARVLPDATLVIPMEAQMVKGINGGAAGGLRKIQPNPFADKLGQFVLLPQRGFQEIQNFLRGQFAVGIVFDGNPLGAV